MGAWEKAGTPQIVRVGPQLAAVIRLTLPRHQLRQVMGPAFAELQAEASVQGLTLGPAFTRPLRPPGDVVELEAGFEVDRPIRPVGRVRRGELPAATVVRSVYRGPYEGLAARGPSSGRGSRTRAWSQAPTTGSATSPAPSPGPSRPRGEPS